MTYQEWVVDEAKKANTDGCTAVSEWNQWCCFQHDLVCRKGKCPQAAYALWQEGVANYWELAKPMSRREGDKQFWKCNRKCSPSFWGRLRADVRYLGVRLGDITGVWD